MRVQYDSKRYTIKDYDFRSGTFVTSNGLKLKEKDIDGFILSNEEYKELKNLKITKKIVKKEEVDE